LSRLIPAHKIRSSSLLGFTVASPIEGLYSFYRDRDLDCLTSATASVIEKVINDIEKYLELAGVNAFNFHPDLEGLRLKHEENTRKTIKNAKDALSKNRKGRRIRD
jgi:hypothetical protein